MSENEPTLISVPGGKKKGPHEIFWDAIGYGFVAVIYGVVALALLAAFVGLFIAARALIGLL